jgi:hypothetical protein
MLESIKHWESKSRVSFEYSIMALTISLHLTGHRYYSNCFEADVLPEKA